MNNEPVAWMHKTIPSWVSTFIHPETEPDEWLPLYTHPSKELTDEEIKSEAKYFCHAWHSQNPERLVLFTRAILRKAQENSNDTRSEG